MSVASELHTSLQSMGFVQLLLAIVFLAGYSVACSPLFGARGKVRAGVVALLAAIGFVAFTQPWVHGVLLVVGAVAGLGLFSATGWALSAALKLPTPRPAADRALPLNDPMVEPAASPITARATTVTRIPAA